MTERRPIDLGTTIAGIRFPFCAMNAAGAWSSTAGELRSLARSATGAIVLKTATWHPFVHPGYRSLHNPGYDKLLPLVRELAAQARCPVVASIAGATADEYANLARAFGAAGAALVEANLADPWVAATLAPWDERDVLRALLVKLAASLASSSRRTSRSSHGASVAATHGSARFASTSAAPAAPKARARFAYSSAVVPAMLATTGQGAWAASSRTSGTSLS